MNEYAILKYRGTIYRVQKQPFESQEQVMDRAWYIAKNIDTEKSNYEKVYFQSLEWVYEKYLKVKYL